MMHNWLFSTRMYFSPDAPGGSAAPSPTPASSPSGGGDGGTVTATPPAGGGEAPVTPASPAPDSAPAPTPAAPAAEPANPWASIGSTEDLDYLALATPPATPEPAPAATPAPTPGAPQPAATAPAAAQPAPTEPQPTAPQMAPSPSPSDPLSIATAIEGNRDAILAHLATTRFALTEEDLNSIETDVGTAVPKLLAKVFLEGQVAMQKFLAQAVPGMIQKHTSVSRANDDAEAKFFEAHKALGLDKNNAQHRTAATRIATVYRQSNPGIPLEQLIQEVGPMVALAVKLGTTSQPVPPGQPKGGVPFRPAVNGGGGSSPAPAPEGEWAGLGRDYD
jgi:hypothetical protein